MKITCHACDAKYTIADEKVSGRTVKIKCKKCGATIVVNADPAAAAAPAAPAGYPEPAPPGGDDDGLMATRIAGQDGAPPAINAADWTVSLGEEERQMSQLQMAEEMQRGVITAETYVWKDGMADWLSVAQVPELAALLARAVPAAAPAYAPPPAAPVQDEPGLGLAGTVVMSEAPAISPFAAPRPAAGAPAAATPAPAPAGLAPVNQPTTAARRNRPAGGSVDVFAAAADQQREQEAARPKPPTPAGRLGERNENSVLFSLSALTATEQAAAKGSSDDAVADLGLGNGKGKSAVDDLMSIGGGALGAPMLAPPPLLAPVVEPPPPAAVPVAAPVVSAAPSMAPGAQLDFAPPKKSKTGLIIGIVAGVAVLGGIVAFVASSGGDDPNAGGNGAPSAAATTATTTTTSAAPTTQATTSSESTAPSTEPTTVAQNDTSGKAPPSSGAAGAATSTKAGSTSSATPSTKPSTEPAATTAPTTTAPPDTGAAAGRDFNKGAATAALAAAAGAAKGCKQPGGPTGSASVRVVFAPSGNVTSANVQGPPFAGTPVGGCIASAFRGAHVPPFDGSPVAVSKTVNIN